jgi:hypothetical protein
MFNSHKKSVLISEFTRKWSWPDKRYCPSICLDGPRKTMKDRSQDSWSLDKDLILRPPKYQIWSRSINQSPVMYSNYQCLGGSCSLPEDGGSSSETSTYLHPEDGGSRFLRNCDNHLWVYMVSQSRNTQFELDVLNQTVTYTSMGLVVFSTCLHGLGILMPIVGSERFF